jgi:tetratricopeptide (TPR) repeat protein
MSRAARTVKIGRAARTLWVRGIVLIAMVAISACAMKTAPPLPPALKYPDFVYPIATPARAEQAAAVDRGWRFLQNDDLKSAEREFASALKMAPDLVPARTGQGYVALAQRDYMRALTTFDQALRSAPTYAPALVGKGQALLTLKRDGEALAAFEAALRADKSLLNLTPRIDVLRFRDLQDLITSGRQASAAGRLDEARAAYQRALAASPDSAVLYRELGIVERKRGDAAAALVDFTRASDLDPTDPSSLGQSAEIFEERQDYAAAEAAYRKAATIEPGAGFEAKAEAAAVRGRDARLPAEFRAIPAATQIRRGDLAALIGVRLDPTLRTAQRTQVVTTDTREHWAAPWIAEVASAGVMPPFDNHTFQPGAALRRVDLAQAVSALLALIARTHPSIQAQLAARPALADVSPSHLNYRAIAAAVSAGVLPLLDGNRFDTERAVSGAEAAAAIDRLRALDESR